MDFDLAEERRAVRGHRPRLRARRGSMPFPRIGQTFRSEALRRAAALGFGGIYVAPVGGSALSRLDPRSFSRNWRGLHLKATYIPSGNSMLSTSTG